MIAIWKQRIGADCAHSQKPVAATPLFIFAPHRQQETKNSAPICNKINEDIKTDQYSSGKLLRFSVRMLGEGKKMGTERGKDRPHRP